MGSPKQITYLMYLYFFLFFCRGWKERDRRAHCIKVQKLTMYWHRYPPRIPWCTSCLGFVDNLCKFWLLPITGIRIPCPDSSLLGSKQTKERRDPSGSNNPRILNWPHNIWDMSWEITTWCPKPITRYTLSQRFYSSQSYNIFSGLPIPLALPSPWQHTFH